MRDRLQEMADAVDPAKYGAVLFGYALCGNGVNGLTATRLPLIIPRAHDCIGLLMGSRERYSAYFESNPGVYFRSTGWLERGQNLDQTAIALSKSGASYTLDELIERYGEDNGRYLHEQLGRCAHRFSRLTFIATGLEPDSCFEQQARDEAERRGWHFDKIHGDIRIFEKLVSGNWDESDFLRVEPGWRVKAVYDGQVIDKEPAS